MDEDKSGTLQPWFAAEKAKLDAEQKESLAKAGLKPFIKISRGENIVEILSPKTPPRDFNGEYGNRKIFRVRQNGNEYDWGVNPRSPVFREIVTALSEGKTVLTILREGSGKEVRDVLLKAEKSTSKDAEAFL